MNAPSDPARGPIYLASRSPRRKELLRQIGVDFIELPKVDHAILERPRPYEAPRDYVRRIAQTKAAIGWHTMSTHGLPPYPVLAADTEVIVGNDVLGKPAEAAHAAAMLALLSGTTHEVVTVVAVRWNARMHRVMSSSLVTLRDLSTQEIARYIAGGEPFDKAGAYGIQGSAGAFISHLSGSYTGVMGLPLYETAGLLHRIGYHAG
jgi:septum formation protein